MTTVDEYLSHKIGEINKQIAALIAQRELLTTVQQEMSQLPESEIQEEEQIKRANGGARKEWSINTTPAAPVKPREREQRAKERGNASSMYNLVYEALRQVNKPMTRDEIAQYLIDEHSLGRNDSFVRFSDKLRHILDQNRRAGRIGKFDKVYKII
jgi:hypothetical protein